MMAPPVDYTQHVFAHMAAKFGVEMEVQVQRRGFYPTGGGKVEVKISPLTSPLKPVTLLTRGKVNL